MNAIDTTILLLYLVGIFALAQWVSRRHGGAPTDSKGYFLASKSLPWWAVGTSMIAANISAEQIIGMSGSGYAMGLAIATYEWMSAITLIIVAKYFLPIFIANDISTMPQFLERRYGKGVCILLALFWLGVYIFVNLTSILWLGAIAVSSVSGMDLTLGLVALGVFAFAYQLYGGLKAAALTDFIQVALLVIGGLIISYICLDTIAEGRGPIEGFSQLLAKAPEKFHLIFGPSDPHYADLPGVSVLIGGLWVMNLSYWGFNQYIIQRALASKSLAEAQKGVALAAYIKLITPIAVILPGIAAVVLAPNLDRPDQAYPTMMGLLPSGLKGLVFAALVAAIVASLASKINSISTIFTLDIYARWRPTASEQELVRMGRIAAVVSMIVGVSTAQPLLGNSQQAFLFIQEFTGFFTPGIVTLFLLAMFWNRSNTAGAYVAALGSAIFSIVFKLYFPEIPFLNRVGYVFLLTLLGSVAVSLATRPSEVNALKVRGMDFRTPSPFNIAAVGIIGVVVALFARFW